MKKRTILYIIGVVLLYVALLLLLKDFESMHAQANIHTFGDAFWYSMVTMTTVGYGDLYPVTPEGRAVGLVFILLSIGVLTGIVFSFYSIIRYRLMPFARMLLLHGKTCCIYSELNEASVALAIDMIKRDPKRRVLFCGVASDDERTVAVPGRHYMFFPQNVIDMVESITGGKKQHRGQLLAFLISNDLAQNFSAAKELQNMPVKLYCKGPEIPGLPGVSFFNEAQCCARAYWKRFPIRPQEKKILIIGDGLAARGLLNQALIINCRVPFLASEYHMFGDWSEYRRFHPALDKVCCINRTGKGKDCLFFHEEHWNESAELLEEADRIVFCSSDPDENIKRAAMARRFFAVSADFYIAGVDESILGEAFGGAKELYTEEFVINASLDKKAIGLHESYCRSVGDKDHPWESLTPFLKGSNRSAADHMETKIRLLLNDRVLSETADAGRREAYEIWENSDKDPYRQNEHERWMRYHCLYNWKYGEVKDSEKRTHPCMVPYEQLSEEEKAKDDAAWKLIKPGD